jgi:hypothetical protein
MRQRPFLLNIPEFNWQDVNRQRLINTGYLRPSITVRNANSITFHNPDPLYIFPPPHQR